MQNNLVNRISLMYKENYYTLNEEKEVLVLEGSLLYKPLYKTPSLYLKGRP